MPVTSTLWGIEAMEQTRPPARADRLARRRSAGPTDARELLREALANLHDVGCLQRHPLAALAAAEGGLAMGQRGAALQARLLAAIAELVADHGVAVPSDARRRHELLRLRYLEALDVQAVQRRLAISRSLYFREHARAIDAVAGVLADLLDRNAGSGGGSAHSLASDRTDRDRGLPHSAGDLPVPLTSFIGREREIAEIRALLMRHRLVTVTGAGGSGKTRIAIEAVAGLSAREQVAISFVDLAAIRDASLLPHAIASTLSIEGIEANDRALLPALIEALRSTPRVLVLDNCEHLTDSCAHMAEAFVRACPRLTVLATSREVLRVSGEMVWQVPPLTVPPIGTGEVAAEAVRYEAVRLFVERARLASPSFTLGDENISAVVQICRRLDALPLAIELVAARTRVLTVEQIAAHLDERLWLLAGGARTTVGRQQALRATLDWSYDLLSEPERRCLRRLAVFRGGWTLDAAEVVCADTPETAHGGLGGPQVDAAAEARRAQFTREAAAGSGRRTEDGAPRRAVLDLMASLTDKSLVLAESGRGAMRYRLLETIRQYADERLAEAGEAVEARDRHLDWFLEVAERAEPAMTTSNQLVWLDRIEIEHDNVRAALDWAADSRRPEHAIRLMVAMGHFWSIRGYLVEGSARLATLLDAPADDPTAGSIDTRASALLWGAQFAIRRGQQQRARDYLDRLAVIADATSERGRMSMMRRALNPMALPADFEEILVASARSDRWAHAESLWHRAMRQHLAGETTAAHETFTEGLGAARRAGDRRQIGRALEMLGICAYFLADLDGADRGLQESLVSYEAVGDRTGIGRVCCNLARVMLRRGDTRRAGELLRRAGTIYRDTGAIHNVFWCLETCAGYAALTAQPSLAVQLAGAAAAMREELDRPMPVGERSELDGWLRLARRALTETAAAADWEAGRRMTWREALDLAFTL